MSEISACMIVKNEETKIFDCLSSIKYFADEIIVVDTGSTDHTIEITKQFTDKIYYFDWCDDFSKARNYAKSHASRKYIFQLDADEIFNNEIANELKELLDSDDIVLVNTTIKEFTTSDGFYVAKGNNPRLFLNRDDINYYRPYHEMVINDCNRISKEEDLKIIRFNKIVTSHYGYDSSIIKNKHNRGISIMSNWIKTHPDDDYILAKLADSYMKTGNTNKACELSDKAFKLNKHSKITLFVFVSILLHQQKNEDAINKLLEFIDTDSMDEVYYNFLGTAYFNSHNQIEARINFLKAIEINSSYPSAYSNLALIHMVNNEAEEAIKNFEIAYSLNAHDFNALKNAGWMYLNIGNFDKMISCFNKSLRINKNQQDLLRYIKKNNLGKHIDAL